MPTANSSNAGANVQPAWDARGAMERACTGHSRPTRVRAGMHKSLLALDPEREKQRRTLLQKLLAKGWDPRWTEHPIHPTPLLRAEGDLVPTALDVLTSAGWNPATDNHCDDTALTIACKAAAFRDLDRGLECFRLLLDRGAPVNQILFRGPVTTLFRLCCPDPDECQFVTEPLRKVVEFLLQRGAKANFSGVKLRTLGIREDPIGLHDAEIRSHLTQHGIKVPRLPSPLRRRW